MARDQTLQPEIYPLTGIRALAALWVVVFHMQARLVESYPDLNLLIAPIVAHGYLGVDLFFILSGFIIHYNYAERLTRFRISVICEFLWMRLARLWPVHAVVLILFAFLLWMQRLQGIVPAQPDLYASSDFLRNLFLIHSWAIPLKISWNVPAWSVSCEWLAYLLFPFLVISKLCTTSARCSAVVASVALVGTALFCQKLHAEGNASYGVVRIAGEFVAGSALCHIFRSDLTKRFPWQYIVPFAIVTVFVCSHFVLPAFGLVAFWCVPLLGIIVLGLAYHRCCVSRLCSSKLMLFGGYISYSLYMVHELCFIVLKRADAPFGKLLAPIVDLLVVVTTSVLLFYFVEEPCRKAMRNLFPSHKQQPYPVI
jgi:peptidoglycan/LPS O-acetylase OafA/YrhL